MNSSSTVRKLWLLLPALFLLAGVVFSPALAQTPPQPLRPQFDDAAAEFGVPADLLLALGWTRSHLRSQVSEAEEYGVMQLPTQNPNQVAQAAALLGVPEEAIKTNARQNIRGMAALLRQTAGGLFPNQTGFTAANWFAAVAAASFPANPPLGQAHARQVFTVLAGGLNVQIDGETFAVPPWADAAPLIAGPEVAIASDDYGPANWVAAHPTNFTDSSRTTNDIDTIVIHTTEASYGGAINWFALPNKNASAHYFVRSVDGQISQMVRDEDVAWHAGHWETNLRSIGIEHEAFVNDASWYTDAMYRASAQLVRHLAARYNIPLDRQHIIGHVEVPGCPYGGGGASCHTDPGQYWNWDYFMRLVLAGEPTATPSPTPAPAPTLPATGTGGLLGLVFNAETNGRLAGAQVSAAGKTVLANQNGVYVFAGLPAGDVPVTVTHPGFVTATQTGEVVAGTTRWNSFWLQPAAAAPPTATPSPTATPPPTATTTPAAAMGILVGAITDAATGRRLAGVTVSAFNRAYVTDTRGYYWLDGLPAGTQVVTAQKAGYQTGQRAREVVAGAIQWNSIALQPQ